MRVGTIVYVTADIDLQPHGVVMADERGWVARVTPDEIWIKLIQHHKGLDEWDNCIWLNAYTDDIRSSIKVVEQVAVA